MCPGVGFERLGALDILDLWIQLAARFITLVVLRTKEPKVRRWFRVPGNWWGRCSSAFSRPCCSLCHFFVPGLSKFWK